MAVSVTTWALLNQPDGGVLVPPGLFTIAREYCVPSVAVKVESVMGATSCARAPPSLHDVQTSLVPVPPGYTESVRTSCTDPASQENDFGLVYAVSSTGVGQPPGAAR